MFHNPIEERLFKTDVVTRFLALNPLMAQDLFAFGEKLLIEKGFFDQIRVVFHLCAHAGGCNFHNFPSAVNASPP